MHTSPTHSGASTRCLSINPGDRSLINKQGGLGFAGTAMAFDPRLPTPGGGGPLAGCNSRSSALARSAHSMASASVEARTDGGSDGKGHDLASVFKYIIYRYLYICVRALLFVSASRALFYAPYRNDR